MADEKSVGRIIENIHRTVNGEDPNNVAFAMMQLMIESIIGMSPTEDHAKRVWEFVQQEVGPRISSDFYKVKLIYAGPSGDKFTSN